MLTKLPVPRFIPIVDVQKQLSVYFGAPDVSLHYVLLLLAERGLGIYAYFYRWEWHVDVEVQVKRRAKESEITYQSRLYSTNQRYKKNLEVLALQYINQRSACGYFAKLSATSFAASFLASGCLNEKENITGLHSLEYDIIAGLERRLQGYLVDQTAGLDLLAAKVTRLTPVGYEYATEAHPKYRNRCISRAIQVQDKDLYLYYADFLSLLSR